MYGPSTKTAVECLMTGGAERDQILAAISSNMTSEAAVVNR